MLYPDVATGYFGYFPTKIFNQKLTMMGTRINWPTKKLHCIGTCESNFYKVVMKATSPLLKDWKPSSGWLDIILAPACLISFICSMVFALNQSNLTRIGLTFTFQNAPKNPVINSSFTCQLRWPLRWIYWR